MPDELARIEAKIDRLRRIMEASCHDTDALLSSPLNQAIDRLVARHARISMNRYRNAISLRGTRPS